ncbi:MAG TPA: tRNA 2-thiouridine(34) synthase MnmA [Anaerolineae bacterium]|nr:tRNA 2-thiouridine(34) synthase MnmA [Anaerolineae bacterium]
MDHTGIRVVVAMSGGVDSSVAAALLVEQGYDVVGIMLRLWSEDGGSRANRCCTPADVALARLVADQLGIPFYLLNVADSFKSIVVDDFVERYLAGVTPNPCIQCNRHIRFELLLNKALGLGAQYLATGHYARIRRTGDLYQLLRGVDASKDQSYVLSVLGQKQLAHALFPLGEMTKAEVRAHAARLGLPVADKADSQDLCFVGSQGYRAFLSRHAPEANHAGDIRDTHGRIIGRHGGLPFYTIGQRKGLGVAGREPMYVIAKDASDNALIVGTADELGQDELIARGMHYVSGVTPAGPFCAAARIRYKAHAAAVTVHPDGDSARVKFDQPQRDITPGQAVVLFDGEMVLGQGIIVR